MKISRAFYANIAVIQFTYWFNKQNGTNIKAFSEHLEGVPFAIIDFGDLSTDLVFKYSFRLGELHKDLELKDDFALRLNEYPLPPKDDPNYSFD